ncbi:hypothetical protein BH10PSE15_BH10PSE15_14740 [soil metagenome]
MVDINEFAAKAKETFEEKIADPARKAGLKFVEGGSNLGIRMLDQAEANTREAFSAMRAVAEAKDLSQVMKIQGDFIREQSSRSVNQAREIGELIMKFGREVVTPDKGE